PIACLTQPLGPDFVAFGRNGITVEIGTVELDDQLGGRAEDVGDVASDRLLSTKAQSAQGVATEQTPELLFRHRGGAAQMAGASDKSAPIPLPGLPPQEGSEMSAGHT